MVACGDPSGTAERVWNDSVACRHAAEGRRLATLAGCYLWRGGHARALRPPGSRAPSRGQRFPLRHAARQFDWLHETLDRKSTRLNSSHGSISYAVFCLKKKKQILPFTSTHSISTQRNKTQE